MHSPEPYGLLIDGDEPTERDSNYVGSLLRQLSNNRTVYQVESLRLVRDLPDGGYVIVQHMGGLLKAIIKKKSQNEQLRIDGIAHGNIPMLFSGVFEHMTYSVVEEYLPMQLTYQARRRLSKYSDQIKVPEHVKLKRFVVEYAADFQYFMPRMQGDYFKHTQYMRLKPTWYSGAMGEVVQIISGYGKQNNPGFDEDSIERLTMALPSHVMEQIELELNKAALPGYTGYPHEDGQIIYDYKQAKNDLVAFDGANKPWLIRIDSSGVYAMPLPMVPATTTEAFRKYIEQVNDSEILEILDRFGGMPSGETFPAGRNFQAWIRAGVIIKICESADFYQYSPVYEASGWAINSQGNEGFNTCYEINSTGRVQFHSYKLKLELSPVPDKGWIQPGSTTSADVFRYVSDLYKMLDSTDPYDRSIIYKIKRAKPDDISSRASGYIPSDSGSQREFDYWDNYTADPIASHSGSISRVGSGVASINNVKGMYNIPALKFPALTGEGCASFTCLAPDNAPNSVVPSDVVVFGCYVDDQLKVIKYFNEPREFQKQEESTFEDVMIVGQWEKTVTTSKTGIYGELYTSDYDERREISDSYTYTHIKGTDMGYGNPAYSTPGLIVMYGSLSRSRYYKQEITTKSVSSDSLSTYVCVPNFNRDAILFAYSASTGSEVNEVQHGQKSINDPNSYDLWTYDPIFHYMGAWGKGLPRPKTGDYVYVFNHKYSPTSTSDFADQGDWYGVGDSYVDVSGICAVYTDRNSGHFHAMGVTIGGEAPYMAPYSKREEVKNKASGYVAFTVAEVGATLIHREQPQGGYGVFFPQDDGSGGVIYFQRDSCRVMFGESRYVNISHEGGSAKRRKFWGHTRLADHTGHHYFFGVINE